jgi:hypothetical protein
MRILKFSASQAKFLKILSVEKERNLPMTTLVSAADKINSSSLVRRYPIPILFLLVLGLTWPFMIVDVLGSYDILPFRVPVALWLMMGYMPTLAAVIVTGLAQGREGIRALF